MKGSSQDLTPSEPAEGLFNNGHLMKADLSAGPARPLGHFRCRSAVDAAQMGQPSGLRERGTGLRASFLLLGSQGPDAKSAAVTRLRSWRCPQIVRARPPR